MANPVVILTFHHVHPYADRLTVPPDLFAEALRYVQQRHAFITYESFKAWLFHDVPAPCGQVLLTFDDGYLDNYLFAYPVLDRLEIPAVVFPVTGLVQDSQQCREAMTAIGHKSLWEKVDPTYFINTAELAAMRQSGLLAFASHSHTHISFCGRTQWEMQQEFSQSAACIRRFGGESEPYGFCWPGGKFDAAALEAIRRSPYRLAFSTIDGAWHRGDDPYTIRRIDISSFSGDPKDYLRRLRKKLFVYGTPVLSRWYAGFKAQRIKAGRLAAARFGRG